MKTPIQIQAIKAVTLYILKSFPEGVDYIKLFKILYFAQQEYLVNYGKVIVEDTFRAKKSGPVPAFLYNVLKKAENNEDSGGLADFLSSIEVRDQKVYATVEPDMDWIAGAEKATLDATIQKYKDIDSKTLSEMSHDTAWNKAVKRMEDDPQKNTITFIDIARAGNTSEEMIDYIREKQIIRQSLY